VALFQYSNFTGESYTMLKTSSELNDLVFGVGKSPSGEAKLQVIAAGADAQLYVWDVVSGRLLRTLKGHKVRDRIRCTCV
jgi:WD40 repeat protein